MTAKKPVFAARCVFSHVSLSLRTCPIRGYIVSSTFPWASTRKFDSISEVLQWVKTRVSPPKGTDPGELCPFSGKPYAWSVAQASGEYPEQVFITSPHGYVVGPLPLTSLGRKEIVWRLGFRKNQPPGPPPTATRIEVTADAEDKFADGIDRMSPGEDSPDAGFGMSVDEVKEALNSIPDLSGGFN